MANPFLFMEEESAAAPGAPDGFVNPFLVEDDDDDEAGAFTNDNPFSASNPFAFNEVDDSSAANVTADSGADLFLVEDDHEEEQQVDPTMSFFGTTINEHDGLQYQKPSDLNVVNQLVDDSINEHEDFNRKPPRPNPPPSQVTQQLITNLTDHLDQTSTNLLGKIPVTRTPSPVSMRDLHSPSPTPGESDLFDVSEAFSAQATIVNNVEPEQKPMRPPPPRPVPPRPTPPKASPVTAPTPVQPVNTTTVTQAPQQQEDDLFNFFGTGQKKPPPKPPAPKTKEDILSLFNPAQPVQQSQKPDLLSEDIDFSVQNSTPTPVAVVQPYEPPQEEVAVIPQAIVEPMVHQNVENHVIKSQSIPKIEMDLTPDLPVEIDEHFEDLNAARSEISSDPESGITSGGIPASASGSILNMAMQEEPTIVVQESEPPKPVLTPPEQLQFLQQKSSEYVYQRPTTPDPIVAQPELAPIFGGPLPNTSPAKAPPPAPPARGGSVLTTVVTPVSNPVVPEIFKSDEFDDFSAKFESKTQPKVTGNAFLDSLGDGNASTADAWGDSDAFGDSAVTAESGFGNDDDGFDSWNPPAVPESTPYMARRGSGGSDEGRDFSVVIRPKQDVDFATAAPILGPPPPQRSPYSGSVYSEEGERRLSGTV
jgi:stonin-1/2